MFATPGNFGKVANQQSTNEFEMNLVTVSNEEIFGLCLENLFLTFVFSYLISIALLIFVSFFLNVFEVEARLENF